MVLFAGLRASSVGTDTKSYADFFEKQQSFLDGWQGITNEPGYAILSAVAHLISDQYWALLITIAVVVIFFHLIAIYKLSVNPALSLFVFIAMGYFTFFFNGARQGIACAIYTLALGPLINGNFKKYAFWVMLAFCFHKSVIIALPLYFLFRQKNSLLFLAQMIVAAIVTILFFKTFLDFGTVVSDKYAVYKEIETTGGKMLTLFYFLLSGIFVYFKSAIPDNERKVYDIYLNMLMFGATIYIIVTFAGGYTEMTRLAIYFQIASIFIWPILFKNIRESVSINLFYIAFMIGHIGYFYIFTNKMGGYVPYELNVNIVPQWLL